MGNGLKCSEITPKNYIYITKANAKKQSGIYNPKLSMGNGLKCSEITPKNYIYITKANVRKLNHQQLLKHEYSQIDVEKGFSWVIYIYHFNLLLSPSYNSTKLLL